MATSEERALMQAAREIDSYKTKIKKAAIEHEKEIREMTETLVIGGAAFGVSYLEGRYATRMQVGGIPVSAIGALGLLGASLTGMVKGEGEEYFLAAGQGLGAAYLAKLGTQKGQAAAQAA